MMSRFSKILSSHRPLVAIAFIVILAFVSLSWFIQNHIDKKFRQETGETLNTLLRTSHQAVTAWINENQATVALWAGSKEIRDAARDLAGWSGDRDLLLGSRHQQLLRDWFQTIRIGRHFEGFFIISPESINLASLSDDNIGEKTLLLQRPLFLQKVFSGAPAFSLPVKSHTPLADETGAVEEGRPTLFVGAPVYNDKGTAIAIFAIRLNPDREFTHLLQQGRIGLTGETYAFDISGNLISESRFDKQLRDTGLISNREKAILNVEIRDPGANLLTSPHPPPLRRSLPFTKMAASAISGHSSMDLEGYRNYTGAPVVGTWLWDPTLNFGIATEQHVDEAYSALKSSLYAISSLTLLVTMLFMGLTSFFVSNSRLKRAELAVRRSQERFKAQFKGSPVPTFTWRYQDNEFTLVDFNQAGNNWSGELVKTMVGKTASELFHDRQDIFADIRECYSLKKNLRRNYWYQFESSPKKMYVTVTYAYIPQDLVLIHVDDITERKLAEQSLHREHMELEGRVKERTQQLQQANIKLKQEINERLFVEQALREERDRAQHYLDTVEAIIIVLDKNGDISLINRKGCEIIGASEEALIGRNWFNGFIPKQDRQKIYRVFQQNMAGVKEGVEYYENTITTLDGKNRLIAWHNSYLKDSEGHISGTLSAGNDITQARQAEELAREHQAELAHFSRVSTMGEIAAGLAHELNQPLTAITIYADAYLQQYKNGKLSFESAVQALELISSQARRTANIINNLRNLLSKGQIQRKHTDLNALIRRSVEFAQFGIKGKLVKLHYELSPDLPSVKIDPLQIEQVVINLIKNSFEAMENTAPENRFLTVKTANINASEIEITVTDNGPGLATEEIKHLFEPFYTNKSNGMGMGLAISRSIIEAHDGRLEACNNPKGGATFTFTLPIGNDSDV